MPGPWIIIPVAAAIGYAVKKIFFDGKKPIILLSGRVGAGKDTVLDILSGNKFNPEKEYVTTPSTTKPEIKIKGKTYSAINTKGISPDDNDSGGAGILEDEKNKLKDNKVKVLELFVFSIEQYVSGECPNPENIINEIESARDIASQHGFVFRVIGTHKKSEGISDDKLAEIGKKLHGFGFKAFELSENPFDELQDFVVNAISDDKKEA